MRGRTHYEKHTTKGRITVSKYSGDSTNLGYLGGSWGKGTQWAGCWMWCPSRQSGDPEQTWWADLHKKKSHHRLSGERRATVWFWTLSVFISHSNTLYLKDTHLIQFIQIAVEKVSRLPGDPGVFVLSDQTSYKLLTSLRKGKNEGRVPGGRFENVPALKPRVLDLNILDSVGSQWNLKKNK